MHRRARGELAERIALDAVGTGDPAARLHHLRQLLHRPPHLNRLAPAHGVADAFRDFPRQPGPVARIMIGPQDADRRRRGMRVGRGNENPAGRNPGQAAGQPFGLVHHLAVQHATVDDRHRDRPAAVIQNQTPRVKRVQRFLHKLRLEVAVHHDRKMFGRNVLGKGPRAKNARHLTRNDGRAPRETRRHHHSCKSRPRDRQHVSSIHHSPAFPE